MSDENHVSARPPLLALLQRGVRWFSDELTGRLADACVAPITPAHAAVLAHLDDEAALSIAELARRAGVTRQTMHRAVTQLVDEGLLASAPGPGFPRSSLIELTPAGRQRRDIASGILRNLEHDLAGRLGAGTLVELRESLMRAWPSLDEVRVVRPPGVHPDQKGVDVAEPELPSNWGRWGAEDQLGTLNLIDADARLRAAAEVSTGRHVSLARPVAPVPFTAAGGPVGIHTRMPAAVLQSIGFGGTNPSAMTDSLIVNTHNSALTHLDALAHIPIDRQIYPGVAIDDAITPLGVRHGSADAFGAGIITRGVLLDLAPDDVPVTSDHRISSADLDRVLDNSGVHLQPGDAIVVRASWDVDRPIHEPVPGLDLTAVAWLHTHDVSVYVGDVGDPRPPTFPLPLHQVALARLGMPLVDAAALDDLAAACRAEHRWSFMLVLAPPPITGTTGLAVNPVAIF